jgi:hypothetical protein
MNTSAVSEVVAEVLHKLSSSKRRLIVEDFPVPDSPARTIKVWSKGRPNLSPGAEYWTMCFSSGLVSSICPPERSKSFKLTSFKAFRNAAKLGGNCILQGKME